MNYYLTKFPGRMSLGLFFLSYIGFRILEGYGENLAFTTAAFMFAGSFISMIAGITLILHKLIEDV